MTYEFCSEKASPAATRIFTPTGEVVYLVEGSDKAMLLDSGLGLGRLKEYVQTLTEKPTELVLTHGHLDHAGGSFAFGRAYLNPVENQLAEAHSDIEKKKSYAAMWLQGNIPDESDFEPCGLPEFMPLCDGDEFDLGGVTLTALSLPGHTAGIMAVLCKEERWILLGDACNTMTMLVDETALSVETYEAVLTEFKNKHSGAFDRVFLSHGAGEAPKSVIDEVLLVCGDIIRGKDDDMPFNFVGCAYSLAKAIDFQTMERCDGGIGNIVYDGKRIGGTEMQRVKEGESNGLCEL